MGPRPRRTLFMVSMVAVFASASGFAVGVLQARWAAADTRRSADADTASRARIVADVKAQLEREMGLVPITLLRNRRSSFVELYAYDTEGKTHYGTAGYLGQGYFITVKHAVVGLGGEPAITSVRVVYHGAEIPAQVVDTGDATVEVHRGDWAVIRSREVDLPPLHVDTAFGFDFAAPIFRLGNDYSRGIILSSGYVGERTQNGLVTCLTDGHPGVSGGGVLDQHGDLVGIPVGRMDGDYRFSFLLPVRAEMLRSVPGYAHPPAPGHGAPSASPAPIATEARGPQS